MKRIKLFGAIICALLTLLIISCKYELVVEPTREENAKKTAADYSNSILPPKSVTASHGGYRSIELTWDEVENAIDYVIFAADTPFDTFSQIAETSSTSIAFEVDPGINKYYSVSAINYFGTVSSKSIITQGSSLATPIITEITEDTIDNSFTINWWMDNCESSTYQNNLQFTVKVYDSKKTSVVLSKTSTGDLRSAKLDELEHSTEYNFQVEAELLNSTQKKEVSDMETKSSAHKITPAAASELTASKGSAKSPVISWKLPDSVWYKGSVYEKHPVYFKLFRKVSNETTWSTLATIGALPNSDWGDQNKLARYHFNCETGKVYDSKSLSNNNQETEINFITITKDDYGTTMDAPYKAYTTSSLLTFTDLTALRGVKYDYYVQSFTDHVPAGKEYTDESSLTEVQTGWGISQPGFIIEETFTFNDENTQITLATIDFSKTQFNPYSTDYSYVVTQTQITDTGITVEAEKVITKVNSLETLLSATTTLVPDDTPKYYSFNLYILNKTDDEITEVPSDGQYLECVTANKTLTIIKDYGLIPNITNFSIEDGYKDKFIIRWNKVADSIVNELSADDVEYQLISIPVVNGLADNENKQTALFNNKSAELTISEENISYTLAANSGDAMKFTLRVTKNGIVTEKPIDQIYYTLGTPEITFNEYDFNKITVSWLEVQKAFLTSDITESDRLNKYVVKAAYTSEPETELTTAENTTITYDETLKTYTCVIDKPEGYNSSSKSGKPIELTVTVDNTKDSTVAVKTVRTLGPAEITITKAAQPKKNYTSFSFTSATGADKYLLYRVMYADKDKTTLIGTDKLIINAESLLIEEENEQAIDERTRCSYDEATNTFTVEDYQTDSTQTMGYQFNQERIQWGYPIGYYVFPLRNKDDFTTIDFDFDEDKTTFTENSAVSYEEETISNKIVYCNTWGYGFNIQATKAESGSKIHITWEKPNDIVKSPSVYRMSYRKNFDYGNVWEKIATLDNSSLSYDDTIPSEVSHLAFVYAVQYDSTSDFVKSYRTSDQALGQKETNYALKYENANKSPEPSNKGYLFSIANVSAQPIDGTNSYKELISWDSSWDFDERALCPSSFNIDILNKNLAYTKDWITIAKVNISPKGDFTFDENFTLPADNTYDININTQAIGEVSIQPASFIDNASPVETNGLLKVLRDTRHYYSFNITEDGTNYDRQHGDESLYTYRNITDTELVKCVNLILADALYQSHIDKTDGVVLSAEKLSTNCEGKEGTFTFTFTAWQKKSQWGFNGKDYIHIYRCGSPVDTENYLISDFTLCAENSDSLKGCDQQKLYYLPTLIVSINHPSGLSSYAASLKITAGVEGTSQNYSLTIVLNNSNFVSISNNYDEFVKWFPYYLNNDMSGTPITSYTTSAGSKNECPPIYQEPWWN